MLAIYVNVESKSEKGKFYRVRRLPTGEWRCECPQSVYKNATCKHIVEAKENLCKACMDDIELDSHNDIK